MTVIGIDNGLSGGLAVFSDLQGLPPVSLVRLPVMRAHLEHRAISQRLAVGKVKKGKVKSETVNEIDAVALKAIITNIGVQKIGAIFFEAAPDHANQASIMKSMATSAGKIMAVLELCGLHGVTYRILSHTWQPVILGKAPRGAAKDWTKERAAEVAASLWPGQNWKRSPRCTEPDTGYLDAALIAHYGMVHILKQWNNPSPGI